MPDTQRGYAAATPPSTLSRLPVVFAERVSDAKCSTAVWSHEELTVESG
jgi:hypothetical protein